MAEKNRTRFSAGQIERDVCRWGVFYKGRRDALVAAGICNAGPFPGDNGKERTRAFTTKDPNGNEIRITRSGKYNFAVSRRGHTKLEDLEFARIEIEREKQEESRRREQRGKWRRETFPPFETPIEFRVYGRDFIGSCMHAAFWFLTNGERGWRISDADHQALCVLKARMFDVLSGARVERTTKGAKLYVVK